MHKKTNVKEAHEEKYWLTKEYWYYGNGDDFKSLK